MLFYVLIYVFVLWVQRLRIIACARSFYSSSTAATAATASASAVHLSFARSLPPVWYWNVNTIQNINTVKFQPSHISTKKSCVCLKYWNFVYRIGLKATTLFRKWRSLLFLLQTSFKTHQSYFFRVENFHNQIFKNYFHNEVENSSKSFFQFNYFTCLI